MTHGSLDEIDFVIWIIHLNVIMIKSLLIIP